MTTNIYSGHEKDIVKAHPDRDRKEREALQRELNDSIQRHLNQVKFWDSEERMSYIANLPEQRVVCLYQDINLLVQSLEEAQKGGVMWPEDEYGPHGFTLWLARLGRRLGSQTCNQLGIKMCKDAKFTVAKGQEILTALKPSFQKAKKKVGKNGPNMS